MSKKQPESVALAVVPSVDAAPTTAPRDDSAPVEFMHPTDGRKVRITEAERKRSALRVIEKAGLWALKEEIARARGWK